MDGAVDLFMYFASFRDLCLLSNHNLSLIVFKGSRFRIGKAYICISRNHSTISLSFVTIVNKTSR